MIAEKQQPQGREIAENRQSRTNAGMHNDQYTGAITLQSELCLTRTLSPTRNFWCIAADMYFARNARSCWFCMTKTASGNLYAATSITGLPTGLSTATIFVWPT